MAYTQSELDSARAARTALINGERVVSISVADRSTTFGQVDIEKLDGLIGKMEASIASSSGRRRFVLTTTSKGL